MDPAVELTGHAQPLLTHRAHVWLPADQVHLVGVGEQSANEAP